MIIVHDIFICKPGNETKLEKLFKEVTTGDELVSIMTDMTGQYNKRSPLHNNDVEKSIKFSGQ
jgi:hypothetical protein